MKQKVSTRQRRIAELLQQELTLLIRDKVDDPRLSNVLITAVQMSRDLSFAKVFISDQCDDLALRLKLLQNAVGFLRKHLATRIETRIVPQLSFVADTSLSSGNKLVELINQACLDDEAYHVQNAEDTSKTPTDE